MTDLLRTGQVAEVEARISDLNTIRTALLSALNAGCDDLVACAAGSCCPPRFAELADPHGIRR